MSDPDSMYCAQGAASKVALLGDSVLSRSTADPPASRRLTRLSRNIYVAAAASPRLVSAEQMSVAPRELGTSRLKCDSDELGTAGAKVGASGCHALCRADVLRGRVSAATGATHFAARIFCGDESRPRRGDQVLKQFNEVLF